MFYFPLYPVIHAKMLRNFCLFSINLHNTWQDFSILTLTKTYFLTNIEAMNTSWHLVSFFQIRHNSSHSWQSKHPHPLFIYYLTMTSSCRSAWEFRSPRKWATNFSIKYLSELEFLWYDDQNKKSSIKIKCF